MSKWKNSAKRIRAASAPRAGASSAADAHEQTSSTHSEARPSGVLVLPGSSLMKVTAIVNGLRVVCPGCDARGEVHLLPGGGVQQDGAFRDPQASDGAPAGVGGLFAHERGDCPVLARINEALRRYEQITKGRFN